MSVKKLTGRFSPWNLLLWLLLFIGGIAAAVYVQSLQSKIIPPMQLTTLGGGTVQLPGKGLSWVNIWSINCPPCLTEMPYLETLHKDYQGKIQVVAVNVPYDPPNLVLDYQQQQGFTLPIALDIDGAAVRAFTDNLVVPSHFLVDPQGKVLLTHRGELDEQAIRDAIEQHL